CNLLLSTELQYP
nr:immunoglobulin light chain junction region [Homo sapiens]